jgi:3-oxoacyl-[acyl-carrier-protein] synthase I
LIGQAVHIAGAGVLSAHGSGLSSLVAGIRSGRCPVEPARGIGYPGDPAPFISKIPAGNHAPGERACVAQLIEATQQAIDSYRGDVKALLAPDCAVVVGTGGFLFASAAELFWRWQHPDATAQPARLRGPGWGANVIAQHFGMRGESFVISTGCSSSANALLTATELLQRGRAKRALVVGAEGVSPVTVGGFEALQLLDPAGCRPFDRDRSGLQLGEAFCALILEASDTTADGAFITGGANLCDTHHLTSASPDGAVMRSVMEEALADAGITPSEIVAIKAHGTGSIDSDRAEAAAIKSLFATPLTVIGLKRYVGHTLGACGTLETAALIGCLRAGFLPSTAGFETVDPALQFAPSRAVLPARPGPYLLNFFGFGGNYTSLVVELRAA